MKTIDNPTSLAACPGRTTPHAGRRRGELQRRAVRRAAFETLEERRLFSFGPAAGYLVDLYPQAIATADFNGDGRLDLATANVVDNSVSVLLGDGGGGFQTALNSGTATHPRSLAVGDLNRDGKPDLITANESDLSVLSGNGDGTFQPARSIVLPDEFPWGTYSANPLQQFPQSVAVGDLNADGKLDVVVSGQVSFGVFVTNPYGYGSYYESHHNSFANVLLGNGDATFAEAKVTAEYQELTPTVALADFDGDGRLDVLAAGDGASVMLGNGDGTLRSPVASASGQAVGSIPVGDFNQDGKPDILLANTI
jgi:hypothetical protein